MATETLYWAWYVVMPIALLVLVGDIPLIIVLTATSRMVAPLNLLRLRGTFSLTTEIWLTTVIALWLPLAYFVWRVLDRCDSTTSLGGLRSKSPA